MSTRGMGDSFGLGIVRSPELVGLYDSSSDFKAARLRLELDGFAALPDS